jgi:hypothetical protein
VALLYRKYWNAFSVLNIQKDIEKILRELTNRIWAYVYDGGVLKQIYMCFYIIPYFVVYVIL